MCEDGEEDAIHGGTILEGSHGPCPSPDLSEASFDTGKSTLAMALERRLFDAGFQVYALDGDNMRGGLSADPGFVAGDRAENIRRIGEVAALMADAGLIAIAAFISP